uniref:Uncharacterized protein n=1 Tax=Anguilla anguilla TaxID=7936 RepID=A0A0E9XT65_ANGAN
MKFEGSTIVRKPHRRPGWAGSQCHHTNCLPNHSRREMPKRCFIDALLFWPRFLIIPINSHVSSGSIYAACLMRALGAMSLVIWRFFPIMTLQANWQPFLMAPEN